MAAHVSVIAEFGEMWTVHSQHKDAIGLGTQAPGRFDVACDAEVGYASVFSDGILGV